MASNISSTRNAKTSTVVAALIQTLKEKVRDYVPSIDLFLLVIGCLVGLIPLMSEGKVADEFADGLLNMTLDLLRLILVPPLILSFVFSVDDWLFSVQFIRVVVFSIVMYGEP